MRLGDFFAQLRRRKNDESDDEPARFAAPRVPERHVNPHPFHAVSVQPGLMSCPSSRRLRNVRFLSKAAPSIPLPGCDMVKECTCHFAKHNDRRHGDRRLFGTLPDSRFYSGNDRRRSGGRRSTDPKLPNRTS
jgi:hypothetical protein